jgi:hypothetical protein
MNIITKARSAAIVILATALLAGCAAGPATSTDAAPETSAPTAQTKPEQRQVTGVEVLDPTTIVVTPFKDTDELFGEEFTVHINDFLTPAEGECGYDEALALADATVVDGVWFLMYTAAHDGVWIDDEGDHYGYLDSRGLSYGQTMVSAGMAYVPTDVENSPLVNVQNDARDAGTGLWASCPGFGA